MAGEIEGILFEGGDGAGSCRVLSTSLVEVAQLIGCERDDLTYLAYGPSRAIAWMSKARQVDRDLALNRNAAIVLGKIHQLPIYLRGAVVFFPNGCAFTAPEGSSE
jgi:hypothetical protein